MICNKSNSLLCTYCSESFYKKCLKLTPKTFNKFHVSKNMKFYQVIIIQLAPRVIFLVMIN